MSTDTMSISRSGKLVRLWNVIAFSALLALILQTIIVTYNVLTGYVRVNNLMEYTGRIVYSTILSTILGLFLLLPDFYMIRKLNRKMGWEKGIYRRIPLELFLTVITGSIVGGAGTIGANLINAYDEPFWSVFINNILISAVINILLVTGLEAWFFFKEGRKTLHRTRKLEQELVSLKFEVLKNQLNPHFLFNSLNVLSGLIDTDQKRAQLFIDAFAKIYHYVLETIERPVVTLEEEIGFARSYMYLQQIRHGEQMTCTIEVPSEFMQRVLPPLSLQVILENIMKHNNTSGDLNIRIATEDEDLVISNDIHPKRSAAPSTGVGQKNLLKRYALTGNRRPRFLITGTKYIVKLPLISTADESSDH